MLSTPLQSAPLWSLCCDAWLWVHYKLAVEGSLFPSGVTHSSLGTSFLLQTSSLWWILILFYIMQLTLSQALFCHREEDVQFWTNKWSSGRDNKNTNWSTDQSDVWQSNVPLSELRVWAPISYWFLRCLGIQKVITHCSPQIPMTTLKFRFLTSFHLSKLFILNINKPHP